MPNDFHPRCVRALRALRALRATRATRATRALGALAFATTLAFGRTADAQAWAYPSFQPPAIAEREFNFGVAGGDIGTALVFQWRERAGTRSMFSLDAGLGDPDARGADNVFFVGGQYAYQLLNSTPDVPLDFLLTAGAGVAVGNRTSLRVPFGLSIGHRFPLDGNVAITPYVHPRVSLDFCNDCGGDESQIGVNFDVGANFELTRVLAIRTSAYFGGSNRFGDNGFGLSLVWSPPPLSR